MPRIVFITLFALVFSLGQIGLFAGEIIASSSAPAFVPPADTPVIPWLKFSIQYAVRTVNNEMPTAIVFYVTTDFGKTWTLLGEDVDKQSPMLVSVTGEGVYGFSTIIATQNRPPQPPTSGTRPEKFVIVDRTPPTVNWLSPSSEIKVTHEGILLEWEARDLHLGAAPVIIEYSTDGGNMWLPVRQNLPAKGSFDWQLPLTTDNEVVLRLIATDLAGNQKIARNHARFSLDRMPPVVEITAPDFAGKNEFDIYFTITDNDSGVASADLYYTSDRGNSWYYAGPAPSSPMKFNAPSGDAVGLYIVATDKRGNRIPTPQPGTPPMKIVAMDMEPPQVILYEPFNTVGATIDANQPVNVSWNSRDANPQDGNTVIEYSDDDGQTWYFLVDKLPASGTWRWTPNLPATRGLLLKITVADLHNNRGYATSQLFNIVTGRPETEITSVTTDVTPTIPSNADLTMPFDNSIAEVLGDGDESLISGLKFGEKDVDNVLAKPTTKTPTKPTETAQKPADKPTDKTPITATIPNDLDELLGDKKDVLDIPMPKPKEVEIGKTPEVVPPIPPVENIEKVIEQPKPAAPAKVEETPIAPIAPLPSFGAIPPIDGISELDKVLNETPKPVETKANNMGAEIPPLPNIPSPNEPINKLPPEIPTPTINVTETLTQAETALNRGGNDNINLAERLSREVMQKDPNNAAAYAILSRTSVEQNKLKEAVEFGNHACRLAQNNVNYLQILGHAEYAYASSLFNALKAGAVPENKQAAVSSEMIKMLNGSETTYQQVVKAPEIDKVKNAYFRLGQIDYFRATKILNDDDASAASMRQAIANYEKAKELGEPAYREVLQIGICNYRLRDYDKAETSLERAIEIASVEKVIPKEAFYYLASIHEKMDRPQQALEYWEKVAVNYPAGNQYQVAANKRIAEIKEQLK